MSDVPFVQARWYTKGPRSYPIRKIVVHDMEALETLTRAEACGNYFATTKTKASAHVCFDANSTVECVHDEDIAYAAPGANHDGLHLEHAGFARQTREDWLDDYGRLMLWGQSVPWAADRCRRYGIPPRFLTAADMLRNPAAKGVTTHAEVSKAWHRTTHTDPGAAFPIDLYMDRLAKVLGKPSAAGVPPPILEEDDMTPVQDAMLRHADDVASQALAQAAEANSRAASLQDAHNAVMGALAGIAQAVAAKPVQGDPAALAAAFRAAADVLDGAR